MAGSECWGEPVGKFIQVIFQSKGWRIEVSVDIFESLTSRTSLIDEVVHAEHLSKMGANVVGLM